jgi:hypothetical protein
MIGEKCSDMVLADAESLSHGSVDREQRTPDPVLARTT